VFLPVVGLVPPDELKPGDLVRACLSLSRRGTASETQACGWWWVA
jgi:hypothetical protein